MNESVLTDMQKKALEIFLYENKDYDLVFDYLKRIGVEKENYIEVLRFVME